MDSMRVATNLLGNRVAVFVVSRWEGALDQEKAQRVLAGEEAAVEEDPAVRVEVDRSEPAGSLSRSR